MSSLTAAPVAAGANALSPSPRCLRSTDRTVGEVVRMMRCSRVCGGRVLTAWLETGPALNQRVQLFAPGEFSRKAQRVDIQPTLLKPRSADASQMRRTSLKRDVYVATAGGSYGVAAEIGRRMVLPAN
jgi:hypothetical protein